MTGKKRRLAAIMFTDIVGYSAMMQRDESLAATVRKRHREVFREQHEKYGGQILQYYGDGTLSIFDSAVAAVECAVAMQEAFREDPVVPLRIGIHTGDITYEEEGAYGDGLNIAARIEPLCTPGGVFVSGKVYDDIKNHPWLEAVTLGAYQLKNIFHDIELFAISSKDLPHPEASSRLSHPSLEAEKALVAKPGPSHRLMGGEGEKKEKDKAALIALLLGWLGVHRFYLGQRRRAILYLVFGAIGFLGLVSDGDYQMFLFMVLIGLIDAVLIYSLSATEFDRKYNSPEEEAEEEEARYRDYASGREAPSGSRYKRRGVRQFRAGNYKEALTDFRRALKEDPYDMAVHFNLACCYSLFDNPALALEHLAKSVEYGFWNFDKIHEHFALENLRATAAFDQFVKNDYRITGALPAPEPDLLESEPTSSNILDQIASLGDLKERGVITEEEFRAQKKRLLDDV